MASVKVKFRPSSMEGKEGSIYYQVIHNRVVRHIAADLNVHESEWNAEASSVTIPAWIDSDRKHNLHIVQKHITRDVLRLEHIIRDLTLKGTCSADAIVDGYRKQTSTQSFFNFMDSVIGQLKRLNRERTSETYSAALSSFMHFRRNKDVQLDDMDADLMMEYEAWLKAKDVSLNTISFYMRILRATYNRAVEKGLTVQKHPFKHVYTGMDKTRKRAISLKDIKRIKEIDLSGKPHWELARDMFLFSFYTRGMSFIDMAYLKKSDLKNGILSYRRHKTGQQLHIKWENCMEAIVARYAAGCSDEYLLPILKLPSKKLRSQYKSTLFRINKYLKEIAKLCGIATPLTMYVSRHSWASIAKSKNIPISVISEGMGHDSEETTRIYLASLDGSVIDKANFIILKDISILQRLW